LAKPGFLKASFRFEAKAYLLTKEEGVAISLLNQVISRSSFLGQQI